jgi:hypothetical protein
MSELVKTNTKPRKVDDEVTECLSKLYATLYQFCRCSDEFGGGEYQANVGLNFPSQPTSNDGLTAHLFILHHHRDSTTGMPEWKEAHLRVVLER